MRWPARSTGLTTAVLASVLFVVLWAGWSMHRAQLDAAHEAHQSGRGQLDEVRASLERAKRISTGAAAATGLLILGLAGTFHRFSERARRAQEDAERRANTFEGSPVALWEEDFSEVGRWLESLRESGVTDLRAYLLDHPDALDRGIGMVRAVAVNEAGRRMIDSSDTMFLFGSESGAGHRPELRDSMTEQFVAIWDKRNRFEVVLRGTTPGGDHLDGVLYWQAARDADGQLDLSKVTVAIVDVTERVAAERQLVRVVENRERLIAAISHELRTPLTSVIGFLLVLDELITEELGSEERFMLEAATHEAEHLGSLVEDLLIAAHHGIGKVPVRQQPVVIEEIMQQTAAAAFSGRPTANGLRFEVVDDLVALADPGRVKQILRNLLTNSIRYGGDNRHVEAFADGPSVAIQVIDDGEGIDPDRVDGLFEPYRPAAVNPNMPGSLGLGLAISRTLARAMDGDLTYHRAAGATVFTLHLPRFSTASVSTPSHDDPPEDGPVDGPSSWAMATTPGLLSAPETEVAMVAIGPDGVRRPRRAEHRG